MSKIKQVIIVGGGTSGWITAGYLANNPSLKNISITLIESSDIPTIGVGEGTFPTIKSTLKQIGISETEFLRECGASFKQAIKFVNWQHNPESHPSDFYYHLFDAPIGAPSFDILPHWINLNNKEKTFDYFASPQAKACELSLGPKKITHQEFEGPLNYAYHLDAGKFTTLLRKHCTNNLGVKHLVGNLTNTIIKPDGSIEAIETDAHGPLTADLFIDCTGFNCLLLEKALGVGFVDRSNHLFVDNALTVQVPYTDPNQEITSHTITTAKEAGWIWDIALQERRGIGYVYSSRHTDIDSAKKTLREYLGNETDLEFRNIPMQVGYREKFWHKNCIAIGLSSGFLEPLESTAIAMIELAAQYLSDEFPPDLEYMDLVSERFNEVFRYRWEAVIDFVKLHYFISKRNDSKFWIDNRNPSFAPKSLLDRLEKWKLKPPTKHDFPSLYDIFGRESYQYVLAGMGFFDNHPISNTPGNNNRAEKYCINMKQHLNNIEKQLPSHRNLLNTINKHGLKTL